MIPVLLPSNGMSLQFLGLRGWKKNKRIHFFQCMRCNGFHYAEIRKRAVAKECAKCRANDNFGEYGTVKHKRILGILRGMKWRCYDSRSVMFHAYGGRGIVVCNEWKNSFPAFCKWALENGYRSDLTIERINNDGNYEPGNCRWATRAEQNRNTSVNVFLTFEGKTLCAFDWAKLKRIEYGTLLGRLKWNWPLEKALNTPPAEVGWRAANRKKLAE